MNKQGKDGIDWCDRTWNPVSGCLNSCEYCYARKIAIRFGGASETHYNECVGEECQWVTEAEGKIHVLDEAVYDVDRGHKAPYPFEFDPTFHKYRLDEPQKIKQPQNIFVCSMADLFGDWVPEEWIQEVFEACEKAPWHKYLFLTKNPKRLCTLVNTEKLPKNDNFWYGSTITGKNGLRFPGRMIDHTFISIEPLTERLDAGLGSFGSAEWIIIGAETGNRKGKIAPEKEWVGNIVKAANITQAAVFMKGSLKQIMGDDFIQEFPKGLERRER